MPSSKYKLNSPSAKKRDAARKKESRARKKLVFRESQSSAESPVAPPTISPPLSNETSTVSNDEGSIDVFDLPSFDGLSQIRFSGQAIISPEEDSSFLILLMSV